MNREFKSEVQILLILVIITAALFFLATTIRTDQHAINGTNKQIQSMNGSAPTQTNSQTASGDSVGMLDFTVAYTYYLPMVNKFPTPTPLPTLYFEDFSDGPNGWPTANTSDCEINVQSNEYRIKVEEDDDDEDECFAPGPGDDDDGQSTAFKHGKFEVQARRSGGSNKVRYGIYINGAGGEEYYLFWIEHNGSDCQWEFIRRRDNDSDTKRDGGCDSISRGLDSFNTLKISHVNNTISVHLNNALLATYNDSADLDGEGTGLYVRELTTNDDVTIRFDNFTIYAPD